ncbi:MAG: hypothetical protein A2474_03390 [Elusimicrobia bacterium RIFOXYC2_FULL_34_12]|nr:MAG: hypothetical protein A2474_03390 [Elusimicrobia bacterium RIFOXYC2_FULL_34_12]
MKKNIFIITILLLIFIVSFCFCDISFTISTKDKNQNTINDIAYSSKNDYIAVATKFWIEIRDADTFDKIKVFENFNYIVQSICFSNSGEYLASGDTNGSIKVYKVFTGEIIKEFRDSSIVITCLRFSPNDKKLASSYWDGNVCIWDMTSGKKMKMPKEHKSRVRCLDFSQTGNMLLSGGEDDMIVVWNIIIGEVLDKIRTHNSTVMDLITKNNKIYSASWDKTIKVTDISSKISNIFIKLNDSINTISLSNDGKKLACGLFNKGTIAIYDVESAVAENVIQAYKKNIFKIIYLPNGSIISAGNDDTVTLHKLNVRISDVPEIGSDIWLDLNAGDIGQVKEMIKDPNSDAVFAATEKKGLLISLDGKSNWQQIGQTIKNEITALAIDEKENVLYVCTKQKGVFKSSNLGKNYNWEEENKGLYDNSKEKYPEIYDIKINPKTKKIILATENGVFGREKEKWVMMSEKVLARLCLSPKEKNMVYGGSNKGGLLVSNTQGKKWDYLLKDLDELHPVRAISIDPNTETLFVARGDEGVLMSMDGIRFSERNFGLPSGKKTVHALAIDPTNKNKVIIATNNGIFMSKNKGSSWKEFNDGVELKKDSPNRISITSSGKVIAGGNGKLYEAGKVKEKEVLGNVNFETNSDEIKVEASHLLGNIFDRIRFNDKMQVIIYGHTDNTGDEDYNIQLSVNRANSVKRFFVKKGIAEYKIRTFGFGMTKPIVSNTTEKGRTQNRRVEILIAE